MFRNFGNPQPRVADTRPGGTGSRVRSPQVTILVGPEEEQFSVYKDVLCRPSVLAAMLIYPPFEDWAQNTIYLPDDGPEEIQYLIEYLFSNNYQTQMERALSPVQGALKGILLVIATILWYGGTSSRISAKWTRRKKNGQSGRRQKTPIGCGNGLQIALAPRHKHKESHRAALTSAMPGISVWRLSNLTSTCSQRDTTLETFKRQLVKR